MTDKEFERNFIMKTLRSMFDYRPEAYVREYASNWYSKGIITIEDLREIDEYYTQKTEEQIMTTEEPVI